MSQNERLFRIAVLICLVAAMVWFVSDGRAVLAAMLGVMVGCATERLFRPS